MLADRIFGAPARRDPPRRRKSSLRAGGSRSRRRAAVRRGRRRASPEVDAAAPRPRRPRLHRPGGLPRATSSIWAGTGGLSGTAPTRLSPMPSAPAPIVVPVALGLAGVGLILRPFLPSPEVGGGGRRGDRLRTAARAGCADRRPRTRGSAKGALRSGLLPSITAAAWARSSTGRRRTLFDRIGAHIVAVVLIVSGLLLLTGRSVSDMVRAGRRGFDRAKRGTRRLRDRDQGEPHQNRSRPDRHCPGRHRARLRAPGARRGRRGLPRRGRGR